MRSTRKRLPMQKLKCPSCSVEMGDSTSIPFIAQPGYYNAIWHCKNDDCNVHGIMLSPRRSCGKKGEEDDTTKTD